MTLNLQCKAEWLDPVTFHYQSFNNNVQKPSFNKLESDKNGECFTIHTPEKIRVYSRIDDDHERYDEDPSNEHNSKKFNEVLELVPGKLNYGYNEECDINRNSSTTVSLVSLVHESNSPNSNTLHLGTVVDFRNVHIYRLACAADQLHNHNEGDLDHYKTKIVHDRVITDLDFSNTWRTLATCSVDRYARIWDLRGDSRKSSIDIKDSITALHFVKFMDFKKNSSSEYDLAEPSSDSHSLAVANADVVKFYDVRKADRAYEEIGSYFSNYPFTSIKSIDKHELLVNTGQTLQHINLSNNGDLVSDVIQEYDSSEDACFSWSDTFGEHRDLIIDLKVTNQADSEFMNKLTIFKKNEFGKMDKCLDSFTVGVSGMNKAVGSVVGCTWLKNNVYHQNNSDKYSTGTGNHYYLLCLVYLRNRPGNHLQFQVLQINVKKVEERLSVNVQSRENTKSEPADIHRTLNQSLNQSRTSRTKLPKSRHTKQNSISSNYDSGLQRKENPEYRDKLCRARFCGANKFVMIKYKSTKVRYGEIRFAEKVHGVDPCLAAEISIDKNRFDFCEQIKRYYSMKLKTDSRLNGIQNDHENTESMLKLWSMACALTRPLINPERDRESEAFSTVVSLNNSRRSSMRKPSFNKRFSLRGSRSMNRLSNAEILLQMSKESKQRYSDWRWVRMPAVAKMVESWLSNLERKDVQTCALLIAAFRDQLGCTMKPYITPRKYVAPDIKNTPSKQHRESEASANNFIERKRSGIPVDIPRPFETAPFGINFNVKQQIPAPLLESNRFNHLSHLTPSGRNSESRRDSLNTHVRTLPRNFDFNSRRSTISHNTTSRRIRTISEGDKYTETPRRDIISRRKVTTLTKVESGTSLNSPDSIENFSVNSRDSKEKKTHERQSSESHSFKPNTLKMNTTKINISKTNTTKPINSKITSKINSPKTINSKSNIPNKTKSDSNFKIDKYGFTRSVFLTGKYDLFLLAYCEWLARNRLYTQRASFLKVLSQPIPDGNGVNSQWDGETLDGNDLIQEQNLRTRSNSLLNCDWCKREVNGLVLKCTSCGHGGHWRHRTEISDGILPVECPRPACECVCYAIP